MKLRDSGMPDEQYWESLFDVPLILDRLGMAGMGDVAELGCGYGTFTLPVARAVSGTVYTFDVDPQMIDRTRQRVAGLRAVCEERDVMEHGFGVNVDAVLLFNILHCEQPKRLLRHAADAGGHLLVIHWRYDPSTPRGPSLDIRPKPEQISEWAQQVGWTQEGHTIDLPPWHFGLKFRLR